MHPSVSRRFCVLSLCTAFFIPGAFIAHAETEAERRAKAEKQTKMAAWILGSIHTRTALLLLAGGPNDPSLKHFKTTTDQAAAILGIDVKPMPAKFEKLADAFAYLSSADDLIKQALTTKYSSAHAWLFTIAGIGTVFSLTYEPNDKRYREQVATFKAKCEELRLPSNLWIGFVSAVNEGKPREEVLRVWREMDPAVAAYLAR